MVARVENQNPKMDVVLWGLAAVLVVGSVVGQYFFTDDSMLLRVAGVSVAILVSAVMASRTVAGKTFIVFWRESIIELRKVVWPTRRETMQSTLAVIVMVFVMGLVLWSIDAILVRVMAWIIKGAV